MATNVDIATLTAKLALDAKNFNAGIDTATQKLGAVTKDNAWSKLGESLNSVAKVATVAGGAIVGMAGVTVKAATDFESAFTGVKKTINFEGTQAEADAFFAGIRQDILDMSSVMPIAAEEIAGVYEAAGQLGIQNENLTAFATAMIGLGSATNMSANEAAVALAQFANVTQMAQTDFDRLGSSIVELGNNMATDERQITNFATELAVLATSAGFSEADILGLGAAMASMGLESAASGTAMQRLSQDMISAVYSMNDSYEGFQYTTDMTFDKFMEGWNECGTSLDMFAYVSGMTAEQFSKAWKEDATSAFMAFIKGLSSQSTADQLTIFDVLDIKQMREIDMLQRLAGNYGLVETAIEMSNNAWNENSALSEEVAKRNADTASQLQMLKNDIQQLAIEAGTALLPVVRELLEQAKPLIEKFTQWVKENPEAVVQLTKTGAALLGIGTAISTIVKVVTAIGTFITTIKTLGTAISVLTGGGAAAGAVAGGGGIIAGLTGALATIGPAILAVGAVVGLFAVGWKNDWFGCQETFNQVYEETGSKMEAFKAVIRSIGEQIAEGIKTWWTETVAPWFNEAWNNISTWLSDLWATITEWFSGLITEIGEWFTNLWTSLSEWLANLWTSVSEWLTTTWTSVTEWFTTAITNVSEWLTNLWQNVTEWFTTAITNISEWLTTIWNNVVEKLTEIWNTVVEKLTQIWETVKEKLGEIWNSTKEKLEQIKETVSEKVTSMWETSREKLHNLAQTFRDVFEEVKRAISEKMRAGLAAVESVVESMKQKVRGVLDAISDAWHKVQDFVSNAWDRATSVTSSIFGGGYASGGYVSSTKPIIVGEEGPEIFFPHSTGYIMDHDDTMDYLGGGESQIIININGDIYDNQNSMKKKLRGAVMDVLREQVAYG